MPYSINTILPSVMSPVFNASKDARITSSEMSSGKISAETNLVKFVGDRRISDNIMQLEALKPGIKNAQGILNTGISAAKTTKEYLTKLTQLIQQANNDTTLVGTSNSAYQSTIDRIAGIINNTTFNKGKPLFQGSTIPTNLPGASDIDQTQLTAVNASKQALIAGKTGGNLNALNALYTRATVVKHNILTVVNNDSIAGRIDAYITGGPADVNTVRTAMGEINTNFFNLTKAVTAARTDQSSVNIDAVKKALEGFQNSITALSTCSAGLAATAAATHTVTDAGLDAGDLQGGTGAPIITAVLLGQQIAELAGQGNNKGFTAAVVTDLTGTRKTAIVTLENDLQNVIQANPQGVPSIKGLGYQTNALNAETMMPVDQATITSVRTSDSTDIANSFSVIIPSFKNLIKSFAGENQNDGLKNSNITNVLADNTILERKIDRMIDFVDNSIAFMSDQLANLSKVENGVVEDIGTLNSAVIAYRVEYTEASSKLQQAILQERVGENMAKIGAMLAKRVLEQVEALASAAA